MKLKKAGQLPYDLSKPSPAREQGFPPSCPVGLLAGPEAFFAFPGREEDGRLYGKGTLWRAL